jgi:hypothetical protein
MLVVFQENDHGPRPLANQAARDTSHLDQYKFGKSRTGGAPADTPRASKTPEQPTGGMKMSKDCGVHSDAPPFAPDETLTSLGRRRSGSNPAPPFR